MRENNEITATGGKLRQKRTSSKFSISNLRSDKDGISSPKPADISNFKKMISEEFPDTTLCRVLQVEPDYPSPEEFVIKSILWLKLSKEGKK